MENDKVVTSDPAHCAKLRGLPSELYAADEEAGADHFTYFLPDEAPPGVYIVYSPTRVVNVERVRKETVI